jgi:hypothetical protein
VALGAAWPTCVMMLRRCSSSLPRPVNAGGFTPESGV